MGWTPTTSRSRRCWRATRSADGLTWALTLRDGLRFHDGAPVLARDCVASIRRWASVDGFGATLMAATAELDAPDDRTIRFRLQAPFPLLPDALGKMSPNICAIMPERLAQPARRAAGAGDRRQRPVPLRRRRAGRRLAHRLRAVRGLRARRRRPGPDQRRQARAVDRVEWLIMPEPASAAAALQTGEVDWLESPPPDLLPLLRRDRTWS